MFTYLRNMLLFVSIPLLFFQTCGDKEVKGIKFEATSESLTQYQVPQWYEDGKFGIYFHWAPFSVSAYKTEWYPHWMYKPPWGG